MLQNGRAKACCRSLLISGTILSFLFLSSCTSSVQHLSGFDQQDNNNLVPLSQPSAPSACIVVELQGPAKDAVLQQAIADPQVQWLIAQLEERRYHQDLKAAQAFQAGETSLQVVIPFKPDARLVWGRSEGGETLAKAVISQARRWEVLEPYKNSTKFRLVSTTEREKVLKDLHKNKEFQKIKKELEDKGHKLAEEKTQIILNESQEEFFIWLR